MIDQGKYNLLGVLIDAIDYEAAVAKIIAAAKTRRSLTVSALAVHGVMTGVLDPAHGTRLNHLDLVAPDGQPVRWALNLLHGVQLPDRVYGPTLTLKVCERAAQEGLPIYLYGSKPAVLEALSHNLTGRFPKLQIAGAQPSRFRPVTPAEQREIVHTIQASGAAITLVGLGCPRQEVWVYEHRHRLNMPMLAVGAAFDFHAGTLSQAPPQLQRLGLEWLYRLIHEPKRLWRRYLLLNPHYLWLLSQQWLRLRAFPVLDANLPQQELRYG
jgi:N-acetylglucosaminyldiphosphoundecaprenol N-acetyl-beta-D-mannosaminyltransferase